MAADAKRLILGLLTSVRGHAIPVHALIAAGDIFGIRSEAVRVALMRLTDTGKVERRDRGQYGLAPAATAVQRHVVAWHRLEARMVPWRHTWIGVLSVAVSRRDRTPDRRRQQALALLGMREWQPGLWVRPDNLAGGVDGVRRTLHGFGLDPSTPVLGLHDLDDVTSRDLAALWDVTALRAGYRAMHDALERSASRLAARSTRAAMVETYRLGGDAMRMLALDPLLPEPLVPAAERRALIDAMRRYDRLGRACWRAFMREHGAPHQAVDGTITPTSMEDDHVTAL